MTRKENFYELLKIHPSATMPEIQAAYQEAKAAFSRDSVATYTLYSPSEIEAALREIEEAYSTLASWDKRREYDRLLNGGVPAKPAQATKPAPVAAPAPAPKAVVNTHSETPAAQTTIPVPFTGDALKVIRERMGLTLDEVARITKIPLRSLKAIEEGDKPNYPARVYLQGFIKNLAYVYKLPPQEAAQLFLQNLSA